MLPLAGMPNTLAEPFAASKQRLAATRCCRLPSLVTIETSLRARQRTAWLGALFAVVGLQTMVGLMVGKAGLRGSYREEASGRRQSRREEEIKVIEVVVPPDYSHVACLRCWQRLEASRSHQAQGASEYCLGECAKLPLAQLNRLHSHVPICLPMPMLPLLCLRLQFSRHQPGCVYAVGRVQLCAGSRPRRRDGCASTRPGVSQLFEVFPFVFRGSAPRLAPSVN